MFYKEKHEIRAWTWGILFGIFAAVCMLTPIHVADAVLIDGHLVFVALSGLFAGLPAAAITSLIAMSLRFWEGGSGVYAGLGSITCAFVIGIVFHRWYPFSTKHQYSLMILLGSLLTANALLWIFSLSNNASSKLIPLVCIPIMLLYPAATSLFYVLIRDVWQLHSTQLRLAESEKNYRTLVESLQQFVYSFDLSGKLISANARMLEVLNIKPDQLIGKSIADILHSEMEKSKWTDAIEQVIQTGHFVEFESQLYLNGMPHSCSVKLSPILDTDSKLTGILGIHHEITELKYHEEQIVHLAFHDPLTQLPNRTLFQRRLQKALQQSRVGNSKVAVAFLDLDRFKQINDTLGHAAGDEVLIWVSHTLKQLIRPQDTMTRYGGDEFTFIFPALQHKDEIVSIIRRMQEALNQQVLIKGTLIQVKGSFGVSFYPDDAVSETELLKQADTAMYFAKKHGRNHRIEDLHP